MNFSLKDLDGLWKQVESHTQVRHSWVEELDLTLSAIETDRATVVRLANFSLSDTARENQRKNSCTLF